MLSVGISCASTQQNDKNIGVKNIAIYAACFKSILHLCIARPRLFFMPNNSYCHSITDYNIFILTFPVH